MGTIWHAGPVRITRLDEAGIPTGPVAVQGRR